MNSQSIEFDKIKEDSSLPEIVRKSFRIPVEDSRKVWVVIDDTQYTVLDISVGGIGIALKKSSVFCVDQVLTGCRLNIFNESITDLSGRIIHFSSDTGKKWQCGLQWIDMKENSVNQISKILLKMKDKLLKDDALSFDEE